VTNGTTVSERFGMMSNADVYQDEERLMAALPELAASLASRMEPRADDRIRLTVSVMGDTTASSVDVDVPSARSSGAERHLTLDFEHIGDLVRIELGRLRLLSVLRTSRASMSLTNDWYELVVTMRPAVLDASPDSDEVRDLARLSGRSDRDLTKRLRRASSAAFLESYLRVLAEAGELGGLAKTMTDRCVTVELRGPDATAAGQLHCEGSTRTTFEMGERRPADLVVRWNDAVAFVRYVGRELSMANAVMSGACQLDGDLHLVQSLASVVGQEVAGR
jgi:hypothetical protein